MERISERCHPAVTANVHVRKKMTNKVQSNTQTVLKRTNMESFQVWIVRNNTK